MLLSGFRKIQVLHFRTGGILTRGYRQAEYSELAMIEGIIMCEPRKADGRKGGQQLSTHLT